MEDSCPEEGKASYYFALFIASGRSSMLVSTCGALNQPLHMLLLVYTHQKIYRTVDRRAQGLSFLKKKYFIEMAITLPYVFSGGVLASSFYFSLLCSFPLTESLEDILKIFFVCLYACVWRGSFFSFYFSSFFKLL